MQSPKLCVVIVTWDNEEDILTCLNSLYESDFRDFKVILVDNASIDQTVFIAKNLKYPIDFIENKKNLYLTGGNNKGISYAIKKYNPEYVMVLNPDTKLEKNTISNLLETFKLDEKIGAVGPKTLFFKNKFEGLINSAGILTDGFSQYYDRGYKERDYGQFNNIEEVFAVSGVCIIYKSEALKKAGLYWEPIKMYLDEVELSIRLKKKGFKIFYNPTALIHHHYMASTDKNKSFRREKQVKKALSLIALRHYKLRSKLAMLRRNLW